LQLNHLMNLKKFLKIKVASLKRCGEVRMLAKKKLKKKHQQHHVVSLMNKKEFQTHAFVVEKKRKNLSIGQKLTKCIKGYMKQLFHIAFFYVERRACSISALILFGLTVGA